MYEFKYEYIPPPSSASRPGDVFLLGNGSRGYFPAEGAEARGESAREHPPSSGMAVHFHGNGFEGLEISGNFRKFSFPEIPISLNFVSSDWKFPEIPGNSWKFPFPEFPTKFPAHPPSSGVDAGGPREVDASRWPSVLN